VCLENNLNIFFYFFIFDANKRVPCIGYPNVLRVLCRFLCKRAFSLPKMRFLTTSYLIFSFGHAKKKKPKDAEEDNLYELLGADKQTSEADLKKLYREKTIEYHPDKCKAEDQASCQSMFIEITNAYEILTDKDKRKKYDKCGMQCVKDGDDGDGGDAADMFRKFYGREPDGKVRVEITKDQWGRTNYRFFEEGEPGPEHNLYDNSEVEQIEGGQWDQIIGGRDEPWLVHFYTPKSRDCRNIEKEYREVAKKFNEIVKIAAVNCFQEKNLCGNLELRMKRDSQPILRWYPLDKSKEKEEYEGGTVTAKEVGKWISSIMPDYTKVVNNKRELAAWAEEVQGKKPCIILLTDKNSSPPLWKALSREFETRAAMSVSPKCDKNGVFKTEVQAMMGMVSIPSIIALDPLNLKVLEVYSGPLNAPFDIIKLWLRKQAVRQRSQGQSAVFPQWTQERLDEGMCGPKDSQWCFIWVKSGKDEKAEVVMRQIAEKYKTDPLKILWVSAELSPDVVDSFGIEDYEDVVVAYRPKRKTYKIAPEGTHRDLPMFDTFVDNVMNGAPSKEKIKKEVRLREEL